MRSRSLIMAVALATAGNARAEPDAVRRADEAFEAGRALMKSENYAQACRRFEESNRLDPQAGTKYNLATCYEKLGRLADALALFEELVESDTYEPRRREAEKQAAAIRPRISWLVIEVTPPRVDGLEVTLDGRDAGPWLGREHPIDLGPHAISARAAGHAPWTRDIEVVDEGSHDTVSIELEPSANDGRDKTAPAPGGTRTKLAVGAWITGGVLAAGATTFGVLAFQAWGDATGRCPDAECATVEDLTAANADRDRADRHALVANVLAGASLAAIGAGVVLYLTRPDPARSEEAVSLVPVVTPETASVSLTARW